MRKKRNMTKEQLLAKGKRERKRKKEQQRKVSVFN